MKPAGLTKLDESCIVCGTNYYVHIKPDMQTTLLLTTSNCKILADDSKKTVKIMAISHNNKQVCVKCFFILVGLERHYDSFFMNLLENADAIQLARKIAGKMMIQNENEKEITYNFDDGLFQKAVEEYKWKPAHYFKEEFIAVAMENK